MRAYATPTMNGFFFHTKPCFTSSNRFRFVIMVNSTFKREMWLLSPNMVTLDMDCNILTASLLQTMRLYIYIYIYIYKSWRLQKQKLFFALSCPYLKPSQYLINKKLNMFISEFLTLKKAVQIKSHQSSYHISVG